MAIDTVDGLNNAATGIDRDGQAAGAIIPLNVRRIAETCSALPISGAKVASYTYALIDRGSLVTYNAAGAGTFTIPTNATVAFDIATLLHFQAIGAGMLTIAGAGGVTVSSATSLTTRATGSAGYCHQVAANVWWVHGDMT